MYAGVKASRPGFDKGHCLQSVLDAHSADQQSPAAHKVLLAVLKQDMSPKDKAAAVATFQVRHVHFKQSVRENFGRCAGHCGVKSRIRFDR